MLDSLRGPGPALVSPGEVPVPAQGVSLPRAAAAGEDLLPVVDREVVGQPDGEVGPGAGVARAGEESDVVYEVSHPAGHDDGGETAVTGGGLQGTVHLPAQILVSRASETFPSLSLIEEWSNPGLRLS